MATSSRDDYTGAPLNVEGAGFEVEVESTPPHEICLTVEHDDSGYTKRTAERYMSIAPEDWDAIVAYVAAERARLASNGTTEEGGR